MPMREKKARRDVHAAGGIYTADEYRERRGKRSGRPEGGESAVRKGAHSGSVHGLNDNKRSKDLGNVVAISGDKRRQPAREACTARRGRLVGKPAGFRSKDSWLRFGPTKINPRSAESVQRRLSGPAAGRAWAVIRPGGRGESGKGDRTERAMVGGREPRGELRALLVFRSAMREARECRKGTRCGLRYARPPRSSNRRLPTADLRFSPALRANYVDVLRESKEPEDIGGASLHESSQILGNLTFVAPDLDDERGRIDARARSASKV
ncbi:hypothetical protein KM043_000936 [Ampulex compressa]|nr:hypothetical protein KM043_000936 [Ampulex compressa]